MASRLLAIILLLSLQGCIIQAPVSKSTPKSSPFKQMNFQDLINRYMQRSGSNSIEGVYTVSGVVIKKGKPLIGGGLREKTTDRKENYATVAILREGEDSKNYIELSLNKQDQTSYSIIGTFKQASSDNLLVYSHYDPKGKDDLSFTFTRDQGGELLEGIRVEHSGDSEITYKLTYVKLKAR